MIKKLKAAFGVPSPDAVGEAERCLRSARQFLTASKRSFETRITADNTLDFSADIPAVVCAAFAVELSFKAILLSELGQRWIGHQLAQLFASLSASTRQTIEATVGAPSYPRFEGRTQFFVEALDALNTVFGDWRYIYEQTDDQSVSVKFMHQLAQAAIDAAAALQA